MMCPISGLVQFLIVLVTLLLMCHAVVVRSFSVKFNPNSTTVHMYSKAEIQYEITDFPPDETSCLLYSDNEHVASLDKEFIISSSHNLTGSFNITANFLGGSLVKCRGVKTKKVAEGQLDVIVVRKKRIIDTIFTASVATLVSILYINFGCAIDWGELRNILKRPVGPSIGFFGHFFVMPMLSYVLGLILFPQNPEMQLGMFFTGVSPAGGASNVWAVLLEGNLNLSIIMTTISTISAFAMMPLWLFTLGRVIFQNARLKVPYMEIMTYVIALVVPLAIGYFIQRYMKRVAHFMTKIIKGFSSCLIMFIVVFAIVTNLYLFELFSWQIIVSGMALPWLGYLSGYLLAKLFRQNYADALTIAIEVGIQNTGIAIFLLRFALPQPQADLTTVAPVSVAVLTPFPLLGLLILKKLKSRLYPSHSKLNCQEEPIKSINHLNEELTTLP
ncbi:hepatic sodium/bile acid cotransporter isoform X2 [Leptinotarsa decemlineata]|uniref:hepatic sodium/bile acid cotransporter isoform X2 n=1 Tax=Leptinotarsa decemlineata TaxID=7539 RepID=UPI000C252A76|nr:ileal sodium/bile acid cotransporter-like isoform X2 [Leptinotarsa decemlineata]